MAQQGNTGEKKTGYLIRADTCLSGPHVEGEPGLNVLAVLTDCCGTDELELPACQPRFHDVRSIDGTRGSTSKPSNTKLEQKITS